MATRRARYYARARSAGRTAYRYGRSRTYSRKTRFGSYRARLGLPFFAGVALGLSNVDNIIPAPIKIVAACLPVQGPGIGTIKAVAQGMLLGDVVQNLTGFTLPIPGIGGSTAGGDGILWG